MYTGGQDKTEKCVSFVGAIERFVFVLLEKKRGHRLVKEMCEERGEKGPVHEFLNTFRGGRAPIPLIFF